MAKLLKIGTMAQAKKEMEKIGVSDGGIEEMAPKSIFLAIKLGGVRNAIANILKQECLSVGADAAVSRWTVNCRKPKTDVLLLGTLKQLRKVEAKMKRQPPESPEIAKELGQILAKVK
ncbi:MAG: hypothetical protein WC792_06075 [Candidatus Micrarchaeia archaeon]|jgi:dihydropteroate synthase